jgi:hypothetical protein
MTRSANAQSRTLSKATVILAVALVGLVAACSINSPPSGGDPGNRRLNTLGADPILKALPPGAHMTGALVRTPARYTQPGLDGGGWHGPAITLRFSSTQPPAAVFSYYANLAPSLGWHATASKNILGYPQVWGKDYLGVGQARMSLIDLDLHHQTVGMVNSYILNASA